MQAADLAALAIIMARNAKPLHGKPRPVHVIARDTAKLSRLGGRAFKRALRQCNDSDYSSAAAEADGDKIRAALAALSKDYTIERADVGGDPRGNSALSIHFATGETNGGSDDGWAVLAGRS